MNAVEAADKLGWALDRIGFLESLFTAARAGELEFTESGLCGLCQNLRETSCFINDARMIITKV